MKPINTIFSLYASLLLLCPPCVGLSQQTAEKPVGEQKPIATLRVDAREVLLPVTVFTSDRRSEYMLLFRVQRPGSWAAALDIPGFGGRADVWVHQPRSAQSLNERDVDVVRRSVRAAPDPWVGAWQSIARARVAGDPVQAAIYEALRS